MCIEKCSIDNSLNWRDEICQNICNNSADSTECITNSSGQVSDTNFCSLLDLSPLDPTQQLE
jgi:hypothetical protein